MANTVKIARKLNSAGVQWDEAQTHAEVITDAVDDALGEVATKDFVENHLAQQDAKMEKRLAQQDAKMEKRHAQQDAKMDSIYYKLDSKMDKGFAQQDAKMDKVRIEMAELRAEFKSSQLSLTRWIIGLGTSMIGLIIALGSIIISNKLF